MTVCLSASSGSSACLGATMNTVDANSTYARCKSCSHKPDEWDQGLNIKIS